MVQKENRKPALLPSLAVLDLVAKSGKGRTVMRRKNVDPAMVQLLRGKNPRSVAASTLEDFKKLVRFAGVTVGARSPVLRNPKDLVARLKQHAEASICEWWRGLFVRF